MSKKTSRDATGVRFIDRYRFLVLQPVFVDRFTPAIDPKKLPN